MKKALIVLGIVVILIFVWLSMRDTVTWKTVMHPELKVSLNYPVHSRSADDPFKGTVATTVSYDHVPAGLTDWTLSKAARDQIVASLQCDPLKQAGAYLPVDRDKPMQCIAVKNAKGFVTVAVIGMGRPQQGTYYPESMLLFLHETNVGVLTKVGGFPILQKRVNETVQDFTQTYPQTVIWPPDENAKKLYDDVEKMVSDDVSQPSVEMQEQLELLKQIATSAEETK